MKYLLFFILSLGCVADVGFLEKEDKKEEVPLANGGIYSNNGPGATGCAPGYPCAKPEPRIPIVICFPEEKATDIPEETETLPMPGISEPPWGPEAIKE